MKLSPFNYRAFERKFRIKMLYDLILIPVKTTAFYNVCIYKRYCSELKVIVSKSRHCSLTEM